jgi:hypothetical protein
MYLLDGGGTNGFMAAFPFFLRIVTVVGKAIRLEINLSKC